MSLSLLKSTIFRNYATLSQDGPGDLRSSFQRGFDKTSGTPLCDNEHFDQLSDKIEEKDRYSRQRSSSATNTNFSLLLPRKRLNTYPGDSISGTEDFDSHSFCQDPSRYNCVNLSITKAPSSEANNEYHISNDEEEEKETCLQKVLSCRMRIAYVCFLARSLQAALRHCLTVAILGMTAQFSKPIITFHNTSGNNTVQAIHTPQWGTGFEGIVLAAFNSGSVVSPFLIGYLNLRIQARLLNVICLTIAGLSSILLPLLANIDPVLVIVSRIFTGFSMTGMDALIQSIWSKWAPNKEKATLTSYAYTGASVGGFIALPISSLLIGINGDGKGWPFIFYFFGSCCFLLVPAWWICVHEYPHDHPSISKRELNIIVNDMLPKGSSVKKNGDIPWRRIFTSAPVWAVFVGFLANKLVLCFLMPLLTHFFHDIFHRSIKEDGLYSTLPFVGGVLASVAGGRLSDWLLSKGLSVRTTRRMFQTIGCLGCTTTCVSMVFFRGPPGVWPVIQIVLIVAFNCLNSVAFRINFLDIAPRFAGLLCGLAATLSSIIALPAPLFSTMLISWKVQEGWQIVFALVAAFSTIGGVTFVVLCQGEVQDWAVLKCDTNSNTMTVSSGEDKDP